MTPEQISSAKMIIEEEVQLADESQRSRWVRNGEDFPDLANLALENKKIRDTLTVSAIGAMMSIVLAKAPPECLSNPDMIPRDPVYNKAALDLLWLGYRLGRRMEHAEMEAMEGFNRRSERCGGRDGPEQA